MNGLPPSLRRINDLEIIDCRYAAVFGYEIDIMPPAYFRRISHKLGNDVNRHSAGLRQERSEGVADDIPADSFRRYRVRQFRDLARDDVQNGIGAVHAAFGAVGHFDDVPRPFTRG